MIYTLLAIVAWLAVGHAVIAGLFWALLQVPESTAAMVALSALLTVLLIVAAACVEALALLSWRRGEAKSTLVGRTVRAVPAFLVSLALFGVVWWLTAMAGGWLAAHRGEMDAWLIVHLKLVKSGPIHLVIGWLLWFVRYAIGVSLALTLLAHLATNGFRTFARPAWLRAALQPRRLGLVAVWMLVFIWLPWQEIYWRPKALPPTWLEPVFVSAKLVLVYLLANLGWALVLKATCATRD